MAWTRRSGNRRPVSKSAAKPHMLGLVSPVECLDSRGALHAGCYCGTIFIATSGGAARESWPEEAFRSTRASALDEPCLKPRALGNDGRTECEAHREQDNE